MAVPADVYMFGATYLLGVFSMIAVGIVTVYIYLPVFYNLGITSTYEYLGMRFDERCRKCASALFALSVFVYLPMVIYVPALAFSAVTGVSVIKISIIISTICVFYTTIGGLKAVVWTDAIQFSITIGASVLVFFLGLNSVGGFGEVIRIANEGNRLDVFDFDASLTKRETFWAIIVGLTVHWVSHMSINQGCTQKFLSVPTYKDSVKSVFLYSIGMSLTKSLSVFTGLIMFAKYAQCDPMLTKQVAKKDQLLPFYVLDVAGHIPGLSGLFIAGIFSAALSTLSANLNSLAGTIYEDFLKSWLEKHHNHKTAGHVLKLIVVIAGVLCTAMIFVVQQLGGLLALSISLGSVAHGPLLGMFTLGVLCPRANRKGTFYGALSAMCCMAIIIMGAKYYASRGMFGYPKKPVSVAGCADFNLNITSYLNETLSFYWYTMIGSLITIAVGLIISFFTEKDEKQLDRKLISPIAQFMLPRKNDHGHVRYSVEKEAVEGDELNPENAFLKKH
ncbi:hypothetical protein HUJ04_008884 [Dendroctonus ponderosae]|uniref:Sodium/solute symporter n=1 Tax=Dendroctonus ponderosae TaxID=77166 RepID=A0AAR5PLG7_DENPD|nr:hypothetical protein HUJ04_008884 [Dendroctonus ponderosae]